jgi:Zn-dependent peptidase ImmA (M78 family)
VPKINPKILLWARETAGISPEEAVARLQIREARGIPALDRLADLETGRSDPTRPVLVRMAKLYRRPLLTFYLSAPPRKGDRGRDFRSLPADYSATANALLDVLIRDVVARQSMIRAALEDEEEAEPLGFVSSAKASDGLNALIASIQKTLQVDELDFYKQASPDSAFALLRGKAEKAGIFVLLIGNLGSHHTAIEPEIFRGFALADPVAPFVIINDQDSHAAWSFTLLHELAHIWLGQTGVSGARSDLDIEKFCNDVAGEFLLPAEEVAQLKVDAATTFEVASSLISTFAEERNLSSSMVAYKLYRRGAIGLETWSQLTAAFRERWLEARTRRRELAREREGGPRYYTIRRHRIGAALIQLVQRMSAGGVLSTSKAGKVLGVKPRNVGLLIDLGRTG